MLGWVLEFIPMFRTEQCAFYFDEEEEAIICMGRVEDLLEDEDYDYTMDVKSLGWLFVRAFNKPITETMKERD